MKNDRHLKRIASPNTKFWVDTFRLLLIHPVFQDEVAKVRQDFGIPHKGFLKRTNDSQAWEREALEKTDRYLASPKVIVEKQRINKELRNGKISIRRADEKLAEITVKAFFPSFMERIENIMKRFNLPPTFRDGVRGHIKTGLKDGLIVSPKGCVVHVDFSDDSPSGIQVNIHRPLTRDEWSSIRLHVEDLQSTVFKMSKSSMKPLRNLDRDLKVLDLDKNESLTSEEIAARLWNDEEIDFSEMKKRDRARALVIRQAKRRLLKRIKDRFPTVTLS